MRWSCPGKIFLLGEYVALWGGPALIAGISPRFVLETQKHGTAPHEASPAGRWLGSQGLPLAGPHFENPDLAGFGGSTAEFLLRYAEAKNWKHVNSAPSMDEIRECLGAYRAVASQGSGVRPSGFDLVAQILGGVVSISEHEMLRVRNLETAWLHKHIYVLSAAHQAARKTKTHEHLAFLRPEMPSAFRYLKAIVREVMASLQAMDLSAFAEAVNDYYSVLDALHLVVDATRIDRAYLLQVPGVLGVKGTGALQSDGLMVVVDHAFDALAFQQIAEERNLRLLGTLDPAEGLRAHLEEAPCCESL